MLSYQECDIVKHLYDAGKGSMEITRVIENRRIKKLLSESDILTDVMDHIHRVIFFYDGGINE